MNLEINHNLESIKRKNEVYFNFRWKKYLNNYRNLLIISSISFILCLQNLIFYQKDFKNSNQFNQVTIYVILVVSILVILFVLNSYIKYKSQKKIFLKKIEILNESNVIINDEKIVFKTKNRETIVKWEAIKNFRIIENCLFLSQFDDNENYEYLIDLNSVNENDKNRFLMFINKKII